MLFNQELCLAESLSLLRLPWNRISEWNPPGVYEGWDQILSLCELKTRQELMEVTNKGRRKRWQRSCFTSDCSWHRFLWETGN